MANSTQPMRRRSPWAAIFLVVLVIIGFVLAWNAYSQHRAVKQARQECIEVARSYDEQVRDARTQLEESAADDVPEARDELSQLIDESFNCENLENLESLQAATADMRERLSGIESARENLSEAVEEYRLTQANKALDSAVDEAEKLLQGARDNIGALSNRIECGAVCDSLNDAIDSAEKSLKDARNKTDAEDIRKAAIEIRQRVEELSVEVPEAVNSRLEWLKEKAEEAARLAETLTGGGQ